MPNNETTTYGTIIAAKQRELAAGHVIEALREGTDLSISLSDFVAGVAGVRGILDAADEITLGDIFAGIVGAVEEAAPPIKKTVRRRRKRQGRVAKVKAPKRPRRKKAPKRLRADPGTVAKRLDAIVAILKTGGGWMKTGDIHAEAAKKGPLFAGVKPNLVSQYLGRLTAEKPTRIKRKGDRGTSMYMVRAASGPNRKAKVVKRKISGGGVAKIRTAIKALTKLSPPAEPNPSKDVATLEPKAEAG